MTVEVRSPDPVSDHACAAGPAETLSRRIAAYSARPSGGDAMDPADVVVALLDAGLEPAFERAREIVAAGRPVRVVGHGVTLRATWPSWVHDCRDVVLTELGAYQGQSPLEATRSLRDYYRPWAEKVFERAAPPTASAHLYFGPVVGRLFHALFDARVFAGGLRQAHPNAVLHLVGKERLAFTLVEEGSRGSSRFADRLLVPALGAAWVAATAVTIRECLRTRLDARSSLAEIRRLRTVSPNEEPSIWFGHVPDWTRANKHLFDAGTEPALRAGKRVGVLLVGSIRRGVREELNFKSRVDTERLWGGLGELREHLESCVVRQAVMPTATTAFARAMGAYLRSSASVIGRMMRDPEPLRSVARSNGVLWVAKRAAAAATLDVARSVLAERAARELVAEHTVAGRVVAFVAASAVGYTSVEWVLRRAGAITVEHMHGAGGGAWYAPNESVARVLAVWTLPDADGLVAARRPVAVAGMPLTMSLRPRKPRPVRRVLILSNYLHRDWPFAKSPHDAFQTELLRVVDLLDVATGGALEFRWRPHPADRADEVARAAARTPRASVSTVKDLADDLDECDVVVSTHSTALIEAVVGNVPFFVQVLPERDRELAWVPAERRFFHAEELIPRFMAWFHAAGAGETATSEADARARRSLFGAVGRPVSLIEGLVDIERAAAEAE